MVYDYGFYEVCLYESVKMIDVWLDEFKLENNFSQLNNGLAGACVRGDLDIVKKLISSGADDLNGGLHRACAMGHVEIIRFLIDQGAYELNRGLRCVCIYGYKEIVDLLIEKGANDWNSGLINACFYGYIDIARLMLDKGASGWKAGLSEACRSSRRDIVDMFLERYDDAYKDINVFVAACENRWIDLICQSIYLHYDDYFDESCWLEKQYDFMDIFEKKDCENIVDIRVKMFDRNLLCCRTPKSKKRKRDE